MGELVPFRKPESSQERFDRLILEATQTIEEMTIEERVQSKRQWLSDIRDLELLCRLVDDANAADCVTEVELV